MTALTAGGVEDEEVDTFAHSTISSAVRKGQVIDRRPQCKKEFAGRLMVR
jgi:hypothetical protein